MAFEDVFRSIEDAHVEFVRLQFVDILGFPKNIVIPVERLEPALEDGVMFDGSSVAGYATIEESDYVARPDPESLMILPDKIASRPTARFVCDIHDHDGNRYSGDPKYVLERAMTAAGENTFNVGPECEFYLFKKNSNKPTLEPNDSAGYFDLSHIDIAEGVRAEMTLTLKEMGIDVQSAHHEVGHGQHEIDFCYTDALTMADWVISYKYAVKVIASLHDLHASFMPKPLFGVAGNGMHMHTSLADPSGRNIFDDPSTTDGISDVGRHFIGGVLEHIKEITALLNPTVNSYKRLVPGYEAPTYISWADRNRSALVRIPPDRGSGARCEVRSPDPSGNPYLQFAVVLAAGLRGVKDGLEPPEKVEVDLYAMSAAERTERGIGSLPDNLNHALAMMEESELVRDTLGEHVFDHFLHIKRLEWNDYKTRVTPWEIDKYLPVV